MSAAVKKRKPMSRRAEPRTVARRRLASAAVRAGVCHIVMPGQVIAIAPPRGRETIAGFLRRTKIATLRTLVNQAGPLGPLGPVVLERYTPRFGSKVV